MRTAIGIALPALLCASCFSLSWERESSYVAPAPEAVAGISLGESTLADCLDRLGAPLIVEELGPGMVAYWGWTRRRGWGFSVDVPLTNNSSASMAYSDADLDLSALLIGFDPTMHVDLVQYGRLADLLALVARRRPQLVDEAGAQK